ncbi:MAG: DUF1501 domain-containing protein [Planctomycetota bacterium]
MNESSIHGRSDGCDEYVDVERRAALHALRRGAAAMVGRRRRGAAALASSAAALPRVAFAGGGGAPARDVLVFWFLRGGMDGLSLCPPYADPDYVSMRGPLAVPPPGALGGALDLDGTFGLHPAAAALLPAYQAGDVAFVQGAGSTDPTRSHFDAMKLIEGGVPNQGASAVETGWLGRHVAAMPPAQPGALLRAAALDDVFPLTLAGAPQSLAIPKLAEFDLDGYGSTRALRQSRLRTMYEAIDGPLAAGALSTLDNIDALSSIDFDGYAPSGGAVYPDSTLGEAFRNTAALIKADRGVEVVEIDKGGWDHHDNQGVGAGRFFDMIGELCQSLGALHADLGSLMGSVTVACMTEFGRRVDANGSAGTDHGRASCMVLMGGNVVGGRVVRDWIGLGPAALDDLAVPVRIDYRDVLAELLTDRMGDPAAASRFPNHAPTDLGLFDG